jgi:class 3 adenylate cyclase
MTQPSLLHHELVALRGDAARRPPHRAPAVRRSARRRLGLPALPRRRAAEAERILATVLFTDIVGSTARAAQLGDRAWRDVLTAHDRAVRAIAARHQGRLVKLTGDGSLVAFEGPGRAIAGAQAIRAAVAPLGLQIRAGLHAGECERLGTDLGGLALHIGARVAASAMPGEIRVSRTVADLVVGSPLEFETRGEHELRGVPGRWELYAVSG